jgi:hypothetical protein
MEVKQDVPISVNKNERRIMHWSDKFREHSDEPGGISYVPENCSVWLPDRVVQHDEGE